MCISWGLWANELQMHCIRAFCPPATKLIRMCGAMGTKMAAGYEMMNTYTNYSWSR
jgi:hypothetical protein